MSYRNLVEDPGPKKLLALDGGGIRGVITLEVLQRIESMLAQQLGAGDTFVLADSFDYIAGTSTGAVIAAGLAKGLSVGQLMDLYVARGAEMFDKASLLHQFHYHYDVERLKGLLQDVLGKDTTFGKADDHLRPGDMNLLFNISSMPAALMYAALNEQDLLCRVFGRCRHGAPIDREVGDLMQGEGILKDRLFSYVRYNAELSRRGLDEPGLSDVVPENVQKLDSAQYIGDLRRVGPRWHWM
jgi:Patatin-like phospholipase